MLGWLRDGEISESLNRAGICLPATTDSAVIEQLAVDFCQLFIGPSEHLPPYQSVWETGQLQGDTNTSMKRYGDAANYPIEQMAQDKLYDHLGIQFDFMGQLLEQIDENGASQTSDVDAAANSVILEFATSFFSAHLTWPHELVRQASEQAQTDFYSSLCKVTLEFLDCENAYWRMRGESSVATGQVN